MNNNIMHHIIICIINHATISTCKSVINYALLLIFVLVCNYSSGIHFVVIIHNINLIS